MKGFLAVVVALSAIAATAQTAASNLPRLEKRGAATQLMVDGKPYLMLGGELHNSSSSSLSYMEPLWPRLIALHLNTVLAPVAWETIEPQEGKFDFAVVDGLVQGARQHQMRLVLLWFGSWKNTYSSYVPEWVKRDTQRFPRVQLRDGRASERLSPFSVTNRDADARAFAALMRHLREIDRDHTVLMVQVENEVGVIPDARDHSPAAEAAFNALVPAELTTYLRQHAETLDATLRAAWDAAGRKPQGRWTEVFGNNAFTDDLFMAWHFARYVSAVTAAGKREYPLPMFANAALIRTNYQPGQYNSGGPLPHSYDLWRAAASNLDFLSPDIYFENFAAWAGKYALPSNPLFIPEAIGGDAGAANAFYAFGQLKAMGFSPFAIEDEEPGGGERQRSTAGAIANSYLTLSHLAPLIVEKQASGDIAAAVLEGEEQRGGGRVTLGDYTMNIQRATDPARGQPARFGVMFIRIAIDEYIVAGSGRGTVSFSPAASEFPQAGIVSIDEETSSGGKWSMGRRLNGDENAQGQLLRISSGNADPPPIYHVKLYRYR